jgi:hypothetical protein
MSARPANNAVWLKTLHQWHWISSALCLVCMTLFALTGLTLNHAAQIESKPVVTTRQADAPEPVLAALRVSAHLAEGSKSAPPLPQEAQRWLTQTWSLALADAEVEWSPEEAYVALPRPGGDAWLRVDLGDGHAEYEVTDRGWISWFNDLHKGRHTGSAWFWFIDVFAVCCLVFTITGLLILKVHAAHRPAVWPVVGFGFLLPALLALLFIH